MIFFLTGFPGTGKSTIGKELSDIMKLDFIDLDEYIEKSQGQKIHEIFTQRGEAYFRVLETEALIELCNLKEDTIIALGGGSMCSKFNSNLILKTGIAVYLEKSLESIIMDFDIQDDSRPLFSGLSQTERIDQIKNLFSEREQFYLKSQVQTLVNTSFSPKKLAKKLKLLTNRPQSL
ncbi:shikimate kinase [bacterium]|nr:shikimate kinase [bacterium]